MKIKLNDIHFIERPDGRPLNPRGAIRDTTDLQRSMAQDGQQEPIRVRAVENEGGEAVWYEVLRGHRRVVAARALGWDEIEAEVQDDPDDLAAIFTFMLSDFVREDLTATQVGEALRDLLGFGTTEIAAAHTLGLEPAKARLYLALLEAPPSVQERVNSGDMALGTFALLRNLGDTVQEAAAAVEKPTRKAVKAAVREAQAELGEQASVIDLVGGEVEHSLLAELRMMRTRCLAVWGELSENEKIRALAVLSGLVESLSQGHAHVAISDEMIEAGVDLETEIYDEEVIQGRIVEDDDLDGVPWDEEDSGDNSAE